MRAVLLALLPMAAWADDGSGPALPVLDAAPFCADAFARGEVVTAEACERSDAVARDVLARDWTSLSPDLRAQCAAMGEVSGSYGVVITCVIGASALDRDAER